MKFRCLGLLSVLLLALFASLCEIPQLCARVVPEIVRDRDLAPHPLVTVTPPIRDEVFISVSDLERPQPGSRGVTLTEPKRRWILQDKTWRDMAESRWNLDLDVTPGHEYVGVRVVLPFGS